MTILLTLSIPGPPRGKQRPRAARRGEILTVYTPKETQRWERDVAKLAALTYDGAPLARPVRLVVNAVAARPQALYRHADPAGRLVRCTKPDGDNVLKIVADALTLGKVLEDDRYIAEWYCRSLYGAKGEEPCTEVWVIDMEPPTQAELGV
jgi:Holliday junction resolvase RusA-like endonuclease